MGLISCGMAACQEGVGGDEPKIDSSEKVVELQSELTSVEFFDNCLDVKKQVGSVSRAIQMTKNEAQKVMQPFVKDGLQLKKQIVRQIEEDPMMKTEMAYFKNLSDEDCAALSFVFHSLNDAGYGVDIVTDVIDGVESQKIHINKDRLLHCASAAVGYNAIKELGVGGMVSAVTVRQAIIAIGKRYLEYLGLVLMVYEFVECIR